MSDDVQKSRRLGRPPAFDEGRVVATARDLFWRKGLEGTSYEELTTATGLHRPSIHAAFGSKRGLFLAAFKRYLEESRASLSQALSEPTLAQAFTAFFAADISLFTSNAGGRGCFALGVGAEAGRGDAEIAELARAAWIGLNRAVVTRVEAARDAEIPKGLDRATTSDLVIATHVTLAYRSRAGETPKDLNQRSTRFLTLFARQTEGAAAGRRRRERK